MERSLDPHDELRRLQDKVRDLELQNEQLRSQQDLSLYKNKPDPSNREWDNDFLEPEELNGANCDSEEAWLYVPKNSNSTPKNVRCWLRQDINNLNDYEMQSIRKRSIDKVTEMEQVSHKCFIDSGTFKRPKKRMTRPGLDVMGESPIFENHHVADTPLRRFMTKQSKEVLDDISMNFDYSLLSLGSPELNATNIRDAVNLNATFHKVTPEKKSVIADTPLRRLMTKQLSEVIGDISMNYDHSLPSPNSADLNATFHKVTPEKKSFIMQPTSLNTFVNIEKEMCEPKSTDFDQSSSSRNTSVTGTNSPILSHTISQMKCPPLNCTFTMADNNSCHTIMGDNGADDDQLSSASDSSFSSNTRLMNAGDVQTIARLQEENLKQMTSTPLRNISRDGILSAEDSLSPVERISPDVHQDCLSDHSDHSSIEGRSKSSVRSSPSCSPYGSTNALANDYHRPTSGVLRREVLTIHPVSVKQDIHKSESSTKTTGQRRVMSGLRPPAVRAAIARPSTAGISNIPRPASRIPAPRVRSAYATQQPAPKGDWMDGCY